MYNHEYPCSNHEYPFSICSVYRCRSTACINISKSMSASCILVIIATCTLLTVGTEIVTFKAVLINVRACARSPKQSCTAYASHSVKADTGSIGVRPGHAHAEYETESSNVTTISYANGCQSINYCDVVGVYSWLM